MANWWWLLSLSPLCCQHSSAVLFLPQPRHAQQPAAEGPRPNKSRTFSLQCLHTVCSSLPSMALQPRQVSRFCANFMMPPEAAEGVVTMMERVCAPAGGGQAKGGRGAPELSSALAAVGPTLPGSYWQTALIAQPPSGRCLTRRPTHAPTHTHL